jgi:hypothetical protein
LPHGTPYFPPSLLNTLNNLIRVRVMFTGIDPLQWELKGCFNFLKETCIKSNLESSSGLPPRSREKMSGTLKVYFTHAKDIIAFYN